MPAGKIYEGEATVKSTQMTIPYTGKVYFKGTTVTKEISGTYRGVDLYYLSQTIRDITPEM